jgi:hypothetical protein
MPTPTYDLIASNVLGSSAASVTFSSLPAGYRDYVLVIQAKADGTVELGLQLNSDTGNNYPSVYMAGTGSSTFSGTEANNYIALTGYGRIGTALDSVTIVSIQDASATDKHKPVLARHNRAGNYVNATAGRWANTSAVTSITLLPSSGNFSSTSTFYLYGIAS